MRVHRRLTVLLQDLKLVSLAPKNQLSGPVYVALDITVVAIYRQLCAASRRST